MINLAKVISSRIDSFSRLVIKVLRNGKVDVQESIQVAPHGIDSRPVQDLVAIYMKSDQDGKSYVAGYLNRNAVAKIGETRIYSTDESGSEQTYIYLTDDGKIRLGGNVDNLIRYSALDTQLQNQVTAINGQLAAIASAIGGLGGTYIVTPITLDISTAKIDDIKTP